MTISELILAMEWYHYVVLILLTIIIAGSIMNLNPFIENNTVHYKGCGNGEDDEDLDDDESEDIND